MSVGRSPTDTGKTSAESIGLFFRRARESQNLSQEQLAELTRRHPGQVSRAMISAVERGRHLPGLEVLLTLSGALHVSPNEVLERLELSRSGRFDTCNLSFEELESEASRAFWAGDPRKAVSCYDAMLALIDAGAIESDEPIAKLTAVVELRRGTALRRCGATVAARAAIERAIGVADPYPQTQLQAYLVLVALLVQLGCLPLARDAAERCLALADVVDEPRLRGWAWIEKGEVLSAQNDFEGARRAFLEARSLLREAGDFHHLIKVEGNLGSCLRELGRLDQARKRFLEAVQLARRHNVPASESLWLVESGILALDEGNPESADGYARAALQVAKPLDDLLTCFRAEWLRHRIALEKKPDDPDRHRVAFLRRLYVKLEEHRGIEEVAAFRKRYCTRSAQGPGRQA